MTNIELTAALNWFYVTVLFVLSCFGSSYRCWVQQIRQVSHLLFWGFTDQRQMLLMLLLHIVHVVLCQHRETPKRPFDCQLDLGQDPPHVIWPSVDGSGSSRNDANVDLNVPEWPAETPPVHRTEPEYTSTVSCCLFDWKLQRSTASAETRFSLHHNIENWGWVFKARTLTCTFYSCNVILESHSRWLVGSMLEIKLWSVNGCHTGTNWAARWESLLPAATWYELVQVWV